MSGYEAVHHVSHLDTLKVMRDYQAAFFGPGETPHANDPYAAQAMRCAAALDAAIAAMERLARVRAKVEALLSIDDYGFLQPPGDFDTVSRAAVLALLEEA